MSSLNNLREAAHDHVLRNTILPDPNLQAEKQRLAVLKHEKAEKEKAEYLASLEIKPSSPPSTSTSGSGRIAKFIPKTKPKRVSRVEQARQRQRATKGEKP